MYKDKDKQRSAAAERQRRYRENRKALLKGVTSEGVTDKALHSITVSQESMVIPDDTPFTLPVDVRLRCTETNEKIIKSQSYNPMMIGYVPPKE